MRKNGAETVDEYLEGLPGPQREALSRLRDTIRSVVPAATETISYRMPTFDYRGHLVAFAAFKDHLSLFPMGSAVLDTFADELSGYRTGKGTISFTPDEPLPDELLKRILVERMKENEEKQRDRQAGARRGSGPEKSPRMTRAANPMPEYVEEALEARGLMQAYRERPPYQQNDYIGWITRARQEPTRLRRLEQMLGELERGDSYMKMAYRPRKRRSAD